MRPLICAFVGLILILTVSTVTTGTTTTPGGFLVIYHAVLLDANGAPVGPGYYSVTFRIFAEPAGGQPLWEETQLVEAASSGMIWVTLGPVSSSVIVGSTPNDSAIADRYLELQPSWSGPVQPRVKIVRGTANAIASVSSATAVSIDTTGDTIRLVDTVESSLSSYKSVVVQNQKLSRSIDSLRKLLEQYRPKR